MREKGNKSVDREQHDLAEVGKEPNDNSSNGAKESADHRVYLRSPQTAHHLESEQLRFCFGSQFRWDRANESGLQEELAENRTNLAHADGWLFEFHVNKIVIAIDFVAQAGNCFELVIQFENFV